MGSQAPPTSCGCGRIYANHPNPPSRPCAPPSPGRVILLMLEIGNKSPSRASNHKSFLRDDPSAHGHTKQKKKQEAFSKQAAYTVCEEVHQRTGRSAALGISDVHLRLFYGCHRRVCLRPARWWQRASTRTRLDQVLGAALEERDQIHLRTTVVLRLFVSVTCTCTCVRQ